MRYLDAFLAETPEHGPGDTYETYETPGAGASEILADMAPNYPAEPTKPPTCSPWRVTAIGGAGRVGTHSVVRPGSPTHKAPASEAPSDPSADARDSWLALGLVEIRPGVFAAPGYEDWTF